MCSTAAAENLATGSRRLPNVVIDATLDFDMARGNEFLFPDA